MNRDQ